MCAWSASVAKAPHHFILVCPCSVQWRDTKILCLKIPAFVCQGNLIKTCAWFKTNHDHQRKISWEGMTPTNRSGNHFLYQENIFILSPTFVPCESNTSWINQSVAKKRTMSESLSECSCSFIKWISIYERHYRNVNESWYLFQLFCETDIFIYVFCMAFHLVGQQHWYMLSFYKVLIILGS